MAELRAGDRVWDRTTTTGTGTITLAGVTPTGYRTFASAFANGDVVHYCISDSATGAWEVGVGTYTSSGTTLSRGLLASSTGSAINFAAGNKDVTCVMPASVGRDAALLATRTPPGGRLTLTASTPVTSSDVTGGTIYYEPFVGEHCPLWDGTRWTSATVTGQSVATAATSGNNYDVFAYLSSGVLALETLIWTDGTTRATGLTRTDGLWTKTGDKTRLYLGTARASAANTYSDALLKRFLWNCYNRRPRKLKVVETADSWSYTTASFRSWNNSTANRVEVLIGLADEGEVDLIFHAISFSTGTVSVGIGLDSVTVTSADVMRSSSASGFQQPDARYTGHPGLGYHYLQALEYGGTSNFFHGDSGTTYTQAGMVGTVWG